MMIVFAIIVVIAVALLMKFIGDLLDIEKDSESWQQDWRARK